MTYLDYYEQGPEVLLAVFLFSLVVTIFAYGLFPFIYVRIKKKSITEKKFKRICYGINAIPMIFFFLLNGKTTLMPYLLWTSVFVHFGKNKLERRGILAEAGTKESAGIESTVPTHSDGETQIPDQVLEEQADYVGKYQQPNYSETTKVKPNSKQRYCKLCGGAIDIDTKKCSKCGKQYFRLRISAGRTFAGLFIILSVSIAALSLFQNIQYKHQISQYQQNITELNGQISELESTINQNNMRISNLEEQISDKNDRNRTLISEKRELEQKVSFYDRNIVFVLNDGTNRYHKYDCIVFKYRDSAYWAYNIENAEYKGYTACFVCD